MSDSIRPLPHEVARLQEQRYRRRFLDADRKQNLIVIALVGLVTILLVRNDFALLRSSMALYVSLSARALHIIVTAVSCVLFLRARSPRQHDRAFGLWLLTTGFVYVPTNLTRLPLGEYLGVLFSLGIVSGVYFFAMRGPIWPRVVASSFGIGTMVVFLWSSQIKVSSSSRHTTLTVIATGNILGLLSARSFEEQRRKRFAAEQKERQAQQALAKNLRELAAEKERVETLSNARATFLAAMSHEFRTPMNAVIGLSDLLLEGSLGAADRAHVQTISDSARALLAVLNDILDFAKNDAQKVLLSPAPFDLRKLAASVVDMLRPSAAARSIELSLDLSPELPEWLLGDDMRLRQVLVNLVSNAVKFTEGGAVRIEITARAVDPIEYEISVLVSDSGIGMRPETVAVLFQPFAQGDAGITRRYGGTGLGLAISRQIVLAMGSDIEVRSELGRGSTFSLTLRLLRAEPTALPVATALGTPLGERQSLRILIVDDHIINREVAKSKLSRRGHQIELAASAIEAIEAAEETEFDVVFMDLQMPGMDGLEATRQILNGRSGKPVPHIVALTASVLEEDRAACRDAGMYDFIGKPIDNAQLDALLVRVSRARVAPEMNQTAERALAPDSLEKLRKVERLGKEHFVDELCRIFVIDTRERLPRMKDAFGRGLAQELAREAHILRSASATIGATEMATLSGKIEAAARAGRVAEVGQWLDSLLLQFPTVEQSLLRATNDPAGREAIVPGAAEQA